MATQALKQMPVLQFSTSGQWRRWLSRNYSKSDGVWLRLFKKISKQKTLTRNEALDEALCFGWIDGQGQKGDEESWLQKFTPRRARSMWSKRNREHVARLIKDKRMTPAGLAQIKAAKADGRWKQAYDSPANVSVPADFLRKLKKNKAAHDFYKTLNKANTYAIAWRLQTAKKPETRERRMEKIFAMLAAGNKFH